MQLNGIVSSPLSQCSVTGIHPKLIDSASFDEKAEHHRLRGRVVSFTLTTGVSTGQLYREGHPERVPLVRCVRSSP